MAKGEKLIAETGAMVSMSAGIKIQTNMKGGFFGALKRNILGGESFFMNTFTADDDGHLTLAPSLPGDIKAIELQNSALLIQSGSYIASTEGIEIDTKWGGAKSFISREGFFWLRAQGSGTVYISSYGAIHELDLAPGEHYTVDTGHMVAFDETVNYSVRKVGGLKSTFLSGEGLVCNLTGPGKITLQTRSEDAFLGWLIPKIPSKKN